MYNDSLETLLQRHYGDNGPTPDTLEQRITASVRQQATEIQQAKRLETRLRERRISRRQVIRLVALGSAGVGAFSVGISTLQSILNGQDGTQPAYSS